MGRQELLGSAEVSGAEQGGKNDSKAAQKHETIGARWEQWRLGSLSQPSPFNCLPLQPSPSFYCTNDTEMWGQLKVSGREVKDPESRKSSLSFSSGPRVWKTLRVH